MLQINLTLAGYWLTDYLRAPLVHWVWGHGATRGIQIKKRVFPVFQG